MIGIIDEATVRRIVEPSGRAIGLAQPNCRVASDIEYFRLTAKSTVQPEVLQLPTVDYRNRWCKRVPKHAARLWRPVHILDRKLETTVASDQPVVLRNLEKQHRVAQRRYRGLADTDLSYLTGFD